MGLSDMPNQKPVKLYCSRCEDVYNPKSSRHAMIDGAYFGTSFHQVLFQVYPTLVPSKSIERYVPRCYGFKVHAHASLIRWQHRGRDDLARRLRRMGVESGFKDQVTDTDTDDEPATGEEGDGRFARPDGDDDEEEEEDVILEGDELPGQLAPGNNAEAEAMEEDDNGPV
jgi:casein kinase II subunit beta